MAAYNDKVKRELRRLWQKDTVDIHIYCVPVDGVSSPWVHSRKASKLREYPMLSLSTAADLDIVDCRDSPPGMEPHPAGIVQWQPFSRRWFGASPGLGRRLRQRVLGEMGA